jgi:hypothetical protein
MVIDAYRQILLHVDDTLHRISSYVCKPRNAGGDERQYQCARETYDRTLMDIISLKMSS